MPNTHPTHAQTEPDQAKPDQAVPHALRSFNRFITRQMGLFNKHLLDGPLTLAEARALFEIVTHPGTSSVELTHILGMDRGQLSRLLKKLRQQQLIEPCHGPTGRKPVPLHPTTEGIELLRQLEERSNAQATQLTSHLSPKQQNLLTTSLRTVQDLLQPQDSPVCEPAPGQPYIQDAALGDLAWILTRHIAFYNKEYEFGPDFERYVLQGLAQYTDKQEHTPSQVWTAQLHGAPVGSIGIVHQGEATAQLRWLLVEPKAQGRGVGRLLVGHALDFCRQHQYQRVFLWTFKALTPARNLYASSGFGLVQSKHSQLGGVEVEEEEWEYRL